MLPALALSVSGPSLQTGSNKETVRNTLVRKKFKKRQSRRELGGNSGQTGYQMVVLLM